MNGASDVTMLLQAWSEGDRGALVDEAIAAIRQHDGTDPYDVVFMDWRMPGMDGSGAAGFPMNVRPLQPWKAYAGGANAEMDQTRVRSTPVYCLPLRALPGDVPLIHELPGRRR